MLDNVQKIHFIGIGGVGMSGLALMMLEQGKQVSGSDLQISDVTQRLQELGATILTGHRANNIQADYDLVIYTSAVKPDNPELQQARQLGLNVMRRAKLLGALSQEKQTIAITGAHGKTTTSAMTVAIFDAAKTMSTFVIGGFANAAATNARSGSGPVMIVEADESDASFVDLHPFQVVITNIDAEHLDFYADINAIQAAMRAFAKMVPKKGTVFVNRDDARSLQALQDLEKLQEPHLHYFSLFPPTSFKTPAQPEAMQTWAEVHDGGRPCRFTIYHGCADGRSPGEKICDVTLALGGLHNISNALAATAVALAHNLSAAAIATGLSQYQGVKRRSQLKGETNQTRVYDDYAHHPTEVAALLKTLKSEVQRPARLWAVFQPHRYSRFSNHYDDFLRAYCEADAVIVLPVYGANETQNSCASPARFALMLKEQHQVQADYVASLEEAVDLLQQQLRDGDVVVTTGAGDVYKVGEWLVSRLKKKKLAPQPEAAHVS